jgi:uncharacterized membrane protein (UPF0127 family)
MRRVFSRRSIIAAAMVAFCGATQAQEAARIEPLSIVTETTATIFSAEIADTDELRSRGLMFRHVMPEGQAMLFDFGKPRPAAMWMKNTYVALDMLFVRADGTIAALAENTEPLSLQTISVEEDVKGVVELAAGTAKKLGIKRNDKVYHAIFKTEQQ